MTVPPVEVLIEELVLHGFPAVDQGAIATSFERSLATLLAERPLSARPSRDVDTLGAGGFELREGWTAAVVGAHTARVVHRGLTG